MLKGGCLCGQIRYEIEGEPEDCTVCHCADCRHASGAPCTAWLSVRLSSFRFIVGVPRVVASSPGVERSFCGVCGTPLTYRHASFENEVDVSAGSLDDPEAVSPAHHTWTSQKLGWVVLADGLPQHPRAWPEP
ncbi:GFA family protein [Paraburkholderia sp. J12]|uniref:GFA family protein n=1 Tax=Paraburkholderia sp. J12 TaxID=2805432 RepID=UPI002ABE207E|nr:GFA family protein [Paraburkholderia sp. J12]